MGNKRVPEIRFLGNTEEWRERKFEDVLHKDDGIRRGPFGSALKKEYFIKESDYVVYEQQNAIYDNYETRYNISKNKFEELKRFQLNEGDFILSGAGTIGKISRVPKNIKQGVFNQALIRFKIDKNITDSEYFLQWIRSEHMQRKLTGMNPGSAMTNLVPMSEVKKWVVMVPSIEEQTKIGKFLKQLDKVIALHQQELDTLKQTKQGFLQKMFPKKGESVPEIRFPGFIGEWESIRLGDRAVIKGRLGWKSLKQEEYTTDGPSMIAGKHIKNGVIDWDKVDHIPQWRYDESPEIMLENGDVIFTKDGSLGNPALISDLKTLATINSTMMLVRVNNTIDPLFFYQVIKSERFDRLIHLKVSGSSVPHLFQADMNEFTFQIPEKEEQTKIGNFFKQLDDTIALHEKELETLKQTKKAFLQKMFV